MLSTLIIFFLGHELDYLGIEEEESGVWSNLFNFFFLFLGFSVLTYTPARADI